MNEEQCQHDEQVVVVEVVKVVKVEEQKEQEQEQSAQPLAPQEQDEPEIEIEDQVKTEEDEQLEIEEALQQKEELEQEEEEEEKQPEIEVEHEKQRETSTQQLEKEVEEKIIVDEWNEGPDKIAPADSLMSTSLTKPVKLRLSDPDSGIFPPISVYTLFRQTVAKKPDFVALAFKSNLTDAWTYWTYQHYWDMCNKAAKSFIKLGMKCGECVTILGCNSPRWFVTLIGTIFAGGVGCGIYPTNSALACHLILNDCRSRFIFVDTKVQLEKLIECRHTSQIDTIVQYGESTIENNYGGLVINWNAFIALGNDVHESQLDTRIRSLAPNKCATLIYTSGTLGQPKAVMISHDNLTYLTRYITDLGGIRAYEERIVSYLPLSHIAAQLFDIFYPLSVPMTVFFAQANALKGSLGTTLQQVQPTLFLGMPRIWEKIEEAVSKSLRQLRGHKLAEIVAWARGVATSRVRAEFDGVGASKQSLVNRISYVFAKLLVLNKIHRQLGLARCTRFYSAAAPLDRRTIDFFVSLGIPLCEIYGLSETSGPHAIGLARLNRVGSVGAVGDRSNKSKLIWHHGGESRPPDNYDDDMNGSMCDGVDGELAVYGRHVFMGYLNNVEATEEAIDTEGWLRTGDLATIRHGFVFITGRLKELIVTAGGENVAPLPIESRVKAILAPLVSNCVLVGDKRKFLTMLVTLKCVVNYETMEPTDMLADDCVEYLKALGCGVTRLSEALVNYEPAVYRAIDEGIKKANEAAISHATRVQKFAILPRDFSVASGEIGPTLKLRRAKVLDMYAETVERLYEDDANCFVNLII